MDAFLKDDLLCGARHEQTREVTLVRIVPTGFSGVTETQSEQKTFQTIAGPALILDSSSAGANQVANGFIFLIWDMDGRELAGAIETGKLIGIAPISLDPIGSSFGNERRTDQIA